MTTIKQTMLRVPDHIYNKLKDEANRRGISVNELICLVLFDFFYSFIFCCILVNLIFTESIILFITTGLSL